MNPRADSTNDILFNDTNTQKKNNLHLRTATAPQDLIHFSHSIMGATNATDTTQQTNMGEPRGGFQTQIAKRINNKKYTASGNFYKDKPKIKNQSETSESMFLSKNMINKFSRTSRGSGTAATTNQSFMGAWVKPMPYQLDDSNFN